MFCELDERQCESVLCKDGGAGCAKKTMNNRCMLRGCCSEAKWHPRFLIYPEDAQITPSGRVDARPAPITTTAQVCDACRAAFDLMGTGVKALFTEGLQRLAHNLLVADGRKPPNLALTQLVWVPRGTLRLEGEGIIEDAKEKTSIIRVN
jgi:hypothetical protein